MSSSNGGGRELQREAVLFDLARRAAVTSHLDVAAEDLHDVGDDDDDEQVTGEHDSE